MCASDHAMITHPFVELSDRLRFKMFQVECVCPTKTSVTKVTQLREEWHLSSYLSAELTASMPQLHGIPYIVRPA